MLLFQNMQDLSYYKMYQNNNYIWLKKLDKKLNIQECNSFINGIERDIDAVKNGIKYHYNNDRAFVFCTSIDGDSLSMWNYYVNNGFYQGYNIGFNMQKLLKSFDTEDKRHLDSFFVY